MFTCENTFKEIETARPTVAVVTIGSTEQHGHHLPLSTDTLIAERFALEIARRYNAYLTPTIPIGQAEMWLEFPGTISFSETTIKAVMSDITDSLVTTGFKTILFVSIHGANTAVYGGFTESLSKKYQGVRVMTAGFPYWVRENWAKLWNDALKRAGLPEMVHADEAESSLVISLRPELVHDNPEDGGLPQDRYPAGKTLRQVYPNGVMGWASRASREKGDRLWKELLTPAMEDLERELAKPMP